MTLDELQQLLSTNAEALLSLHCSDEPAAFAMQFHGYDKLPVRAMAEQLACRQKAVKKLPILSRHTLLYTPLALEQASGERTAQYKKTLLSGARLIDLSGGLGVDSMILASAFHEVLSCERDRLLCALLKHNLAIMGISNVVIQHGESIDLLASYPDDFFDWIYVDPARREQGGRSVGLEAASPDVIACHELLLRKAPKVCIKASPALEVSGLKQLLPALQSVIVLSVDRECKEILLLLERGEPAEAPVTIKAVCLKSDSDTVTEVIGDAGVARVVADAVKPFFYEPDPAIIKAKLSALLARNYGLEFVNNSVDYLTSEQDIEAFPGRKFRMIAFVPYKPKSFRRFLAQHHIAGASIQRRNFPLSVAELRRKYQLLENDRTFLFFTRDRNGQPLCIYCLRVFPGDAAAPSAPCQSAAPEC